MGGPGDPEWERRRKVLHGEAAKPDAGAEGGAFTGDGPAGENLGEPEIAPDGGGEPLDPDNKADPDDEPKAKKG